MKNTDALYGNCKPFLGFVAPVFSNILIAFCLSEFFQINKPGFIALSSLLFIAYLFIFFSAFNIKSIKDFMYFDNFEMTKRKKNGVILGLSFIAELITLAFIYYR